MNKVQTDNSYFEAKVALRVDHLPAGPVRVLDCYGGTGRLWAEVQRRLPDRDITTLRIDQKPMRGGVYLQGDNRKFLASLDLGKFNVIDLDAYGVPFDQLDTVFTRIGSGPPAGRKWAVFVTYIQSGVGVLPMGMLARLGYPSEMVAKCPTIFYRHGLEKFRAYLSSYGVRQIVRYSDSPGRKHYVYFEYPGPG